MVSIKDSVSLNNLRVAIYKIRECISKEVDLTDNDDKVIRKIFSAVNPYKGLGLIEDFHVEKKEERVNAGGRVRVFSLSLLRKEVKAIEVEITISAECIEIPWFNGG